MARGGPNGAPERPGPAWDCFWVSPGARLAPILGPFGGIFSMIFAIRNSNVCLRVFDSVLAPFWVHFGNLFK